MDKTLHKKLTEKHLYPGTSALVHGDGGDLLSGMRQEMRILQCAAKELLQPRPEAILSILEKARAL